MSLLIGTEGGEGRVMAADDIFIDGTLKQPLYLHTPARLVVVICLLYSNNVLVILFYTSNPRVLTLRSLPDPER